MYPDPCGYNTPATKKAQEAIARVWNLRTEAGIPDGATVVCVRGNHDQVGLASLFRGGPALEFGRGQGTHRDLLGLRWAGFTGVRAVGDRGADPAQDAKLQQRIERLPAADVLVAHMPAAGLLDTDERCGYGHTALLTYMSTHSPRLFMHGHVHESKGITSFGSTVVSNAATTWHVLDV